MPKDNEVDEKVEDFFDRLYGMTFRLFLDQNSEEDEGNTVELRLAATVDNLALFEMQDHAVLYSAATVAELRAEVERLRADAYKFRRLARLLDGFDFRLGRNVLMPPATYLDSVEITCEFQPGVGQSVIDAIMDTLTGADPT